MRGFDNAKGRANKSPRMSDYADMCEWPEKDFRPFRMIGPVYTIRNFWFTIATDRRPEGVSIPKMCLDHDGYIDDYVSEICPFRASGLGREAGEYYVNVIDRDEQEGRDYPPLRIPKEKHLDYVARWVKAGDSRLTPCRLLLIPDSQIENLQSLKKLNTAVNREGVKKAFDISDPRWGCDVLLKYDPTKQGPAKYNIQKGDRTPLTPQELEYGLYRADMLKPLRLEEAKREMEDLATKIVKKERNDRAGGSAPAARRREPDDPMVEADSAYLGSADLEEPVADRRAAPRRRDPYADEPRERGRGAADPYDYGAGDLDQDFDRQPPREAVRRPAPARRDDYDREPPQQRRPAPARRDDYPTDYDDRRPAARPPAREPARRPPPRRDDYDDRGYDAPAGRPAPRDRGY